MRRDLAAVRQEWLAESDDERPRCEKSDFLQYIGLLSRICGLGVRP
jgi:hypothetical protein